MPKPGRSNETILKPAILSEIAERLFRVVECINARSGGLTASFPFTYIDLTAGPGLHDGNIAGAAAVFHSMLSNQQFAYAMHLIEARKREYQSLNAFFADDRNVHCHYGRSEVIAPHVLGQLRYSPFGLICLDANGCGENERELITAVGNCTRTLRMDWLIHCPTRCIKRVRRCRDTKFSMQLIQLLALTRKNRGLIKRSPVYSKQDWHYILLTNAGPATINQSRRQGWHDLDTAEGRSLLMFANYTADELQEIEQPCLF